MIDTYIDLLVLSVRNSEVLLKNILKNLKNDSNCSIDSELWNKLIIVKELLDYIYMSYLDSITEIREIIDIKLDRVNYNELLEVLKDLDRIDDIRQREEVCKLLKEWKYDNYLY